MSEEQPQVRVRELVKEYKEGDVTRRVLRSLDLDIARGELIVLVGRSGSGKSTLLNLIGGLDRPTSGFVEINGRRLSDLSERERTLFRRQHIGFVFQSFNLIPTLTVDENVRLPIELNGRAGAEDRKAAHYYLDRVGLADRAATFPDRLSGGEQQRFAIARAMAHNPVLVLADEPTGNLDAETATVVMDMLEELVREQGLTMLIATHDLDFVQRADRLLTLHDGRIASDDEPKVPG